MFRNLLLVLYEALTGYTVVTDGFREVTTQNKNIQIPNYRVVKKGEDKKRKKGEKNPLESSIRQNHQIILRNI